MQTCLSWLQRFTQCCENCMAVLPFKNYSGFCKVSTCSSSVSHETATILTQTSYSNSKICYSVLPWDRKDLCVAHWEHTRLLEGHACLVRSLHNHISQRAMLLIKICPHHPETPPDSHSTWANICRSVSNRFTLWGSLSLENVCTGLLVCPWAHLSVWAYLLVRENVLGKYVYTHIDLHALQCFPQTQVAHRH